MSDFADGLVLGMMFGGGSEEDNDDWQPPADWLPVPEPEPWEVYLLIELRGSDVSSLQYNLTFANPIDCYIGEGTLIIDWGDGTVEPYEGVVRDENGQVISGTQWYSSYHTYEKQGQYIIKITTQKENCLFYTTSGRNYYSGGILIAKLGSNIRLKSDIKRNINPLGNNYTLHYVSVKNTLGFTGYCFSNCYALKKIELAAPLSEIPESFLYDNYALTKFDFSETLTINTYALYETRFKKLSLPKCTEIKKSSCQYMRALTEVHAPLCISIENGAFIDCMSLTEIYAPNCTSVGDGAFSYCYNLEKVTFAENCTFGKNVFSNCYNLYPLPDGATN